jgi:superfamily II DNA or RNA helicase
MPKGGFGNLIALPLQFKAREQENSVFVDGSFKPLPDQWSFLSNIKRLDAVFVHNLASEAGRHGQVIGVHIGDPDNAQVRKPWSKKVSGRPRKFVITEPLPKYIAVVHSQRLFVEKATLPSTLLNQIKRLAAFQNPEFYQKQRMRLSTHDTPRVISCAEDLPEYIALPRGCLTDLEALLSENGVDLVVDDKRVEGEPLDVTFNGNLTPVQEASASSLLKSDIGVFIGPPGIGKTVLGTYLVAQRRRSTLVLVHRQHLLDQWLAQLSMFLGIDEKHIGQLGGGKNRLNGRLDVAMLQSLNRKDIVDERVADYGHVIVDECHHLPAFSFERILSEIKARFIVGLTATPQRRDGRHPILHMHLGQVRFSVDSKNQAARRPFDHKLIVRETDFQPVLLGDGASIQEIYSELVNDRNRNDMIFDDVVHALEEKRSPILLTERRDHLEHFVNKLRNFTRHLVVLHGGMTAKERKETLRLLASIPDSEERLIIATGRYVGEGFDDPRLDTLFLTLPVSWKGTIIQYSGRLQRLHPGKTEVRIYDYIDRAVPMLMKMFERRLREYRAIGYARHEAPLGYSPPPEEPTIEWD